MKSVYWITHHFHFKDLYKRPFFLDSAESWKNCLGWGQNAYSISQPLSHGRCPPLLWFTPLSTALPPSVVPWPHIYIVFTWGYHRDPWWGRQRTLVKKCCLALHHVSSHSLQGLCSLRELASLHIAWALVGLEKKCTWFCTYLAFGRPGFSLSIVGSLSIIAGSVHLSTSSDSSEAQLKEHKF